MKSSRRRSRRRGFALPLVVLLALIASLIVAIVLDRSTMEARTVRRQLDGYVDDHFGKGLQELIDSWLKSVANRSVADMLEEDGHAADMDLAGGVTLRLYMRDAQGAVLTEFATMQGDSLTDAQGVADAFASIAPDDLRKAREGFKSEQVGANLAGQTVLTRRYGPLSVSANSAPYPVLMAVGMYAGGPDLASELIDEIESRRSQQLLAATDLTGLIAGLKTEPEVRETLKRLLTTEPSLWEVTALLYRKGQESGPPEAVYTGVTLLTGKGALTRDRNSAGGLTRISSILDWKRVAER